MSNPTFVSGPISFPAAVALEKFRLVTVNADGALEYAGAAGPVFGAVTEKADPANHALPTTVAVHYGTSAVKLTVAGGDAAAIKAGDGVFAAANGEAAATGTVLVGVAARDGDGTRVVTVLNQLPAAPAGV